MSPFKLITSRFTIATSLVVALSSFASADRAVAPHENLPPTHFSEAPTPGLMAPPDAQPLALDRASVRAALARARASNLASFRAYQKQGVFPSNTFEDRKLNVWRDRDGHLCAAATIINASGQNALVARVAEQTNFIRLADVTQGPLMDWILESGFTQDEIAAIQEPFRPVTKRPVPEPVVDPIVADRRMRAAEDARLRARYIAVTRMLVANEKTSLDTATDRLMKHPQLAWRLLGATD